MYKIQAQHLTFMFLLCTDVKDLEAGLVQLILMSPESLFGGKWRELFSSSIYDEKLKVVVIDEAHCVLAW